MQKQIVAAIFETVPQAERAIAELRETGVPDQAISVVTVGDERIGDGSASGHRKLEETGDGRKAGVVKGLATGGAVGAIAGLAALAIPGVGPFIAAGAIGEAFGAAGSALLVSSAVGATAGGLTGALVDYGLDHEQAEAFEKRIREGATLVAVETQGSDHNFATARAVLRAAGGETPAARSEAHA